jgi:hypothetical protein
LEKAALLKSEETASVHRMENIQLLERWKVKMNEEADRMNEVNEFFSSLMDACKRIQLEQKADELTSSVKNISASTLLDMGRSSTFAFIPTTIKRNFVSRPPFLVTYPLDSKGTRKRSTM